MDDASFYEDEHTQIFLADCRTAPGLVEKPVHLIVTSPPYNLGKDYGTANDQLSYERYLSDVEEWGIAWKELLAPGARVAINIPVDTNGERNGRGNGSRKLTSSKRFLLADYHRIFERLGYIYNTTILWNEGNVSRRTAWGSWKSASDPWVTTPTEAILVYSWRTRKRPDAAGKKSGIWRDEFLKWSLGTWDFAGESPSRVGGHPAAFPRELPRRIIRLFSFIGDTVLDPFNGSGTTTAEARALGRYGIGFDIEPTYCSYAVARAQDICFGSGNPPDPYVPDPAALTKNVNKNARKAARGQLLFTSIDGHPEGNQPTR
ncbi:MAG: site-specific DNA-methyltransferase [Chloroflexi bacterium]|nr:site-specific DNA-methyltransferase [Chloroflexota bacterium]